MASVHERERALIADEIRHVVAALRRNRTPEQGDSSDGSEDHLSESFRLLRRKLYTWGEISAVPPLDFLSPFLLVCQCESASGPITGAALDSIYSLLSSGLLQPETPGATDAIRTVADAVSHCRFEATDPAHDDTVLARITSVLLAALRCPIGNLLSDDHVCAMVYATFHIGHHTGRESTLLVHSSRATLVELVRTVFSSAALSQKSTASDVASVHVDAEADAVLAPCWGVSAACDVFSFIVSLIAFDDDKNSNELAGTGLILAATAITAGGAAFAEVPHLTVLLRENLSRALVTAADLGSPSTMNAAFGLMVTLYMRYRQILGVQLELWLTNVILPLAEGGSGTPSQVQRAALEAIADLCRQTTFVTDLFCNFDCDLRSPNLFARTAALLCKSAFPVSGPMMANHTVALEALLSVLAVLTDRSPGPEQHIVIEPPPPLADLTSYDPSIWQEPPGLARDAASAAAAGDLRMCALYLRKLKFLKERIAVGSDHFNRDAKKGIQFLTTVHLLPSEPDSAAVACFLRYAIGLDKTAIGDYLGEKDAFAVSVLDHFAHLFDFKGLNLERALRLFLDTFRLPGESQKIERCMEAFAAHYFESNVGLPTGVAANADAACVLSYSTIMLNTDLHSTQVKRKMTLDEFKRNNRGTNNKLDWPSEYLTDIYNSIAADAIKMTDSVSHVGLRTRMTASQWTVATRATTRGGGSLLPLPALGPGAVVLGALLDKELFGTIWGPAIAAISVVFEYAEDPYLLREAISGFSAVARVASAHRLGGVIDHQIATLCKFVQVSAGPQALTQFAADPKVALALSSVFELAHKYGDMLKVGWGNVIECLLKLNSLDLLAQSLEDDSDCGEGLGVAAVRARCRTAGGGTRDAAGSGILRGLNSFLSLDDGSSGMAVKEEVQLAEARSRQFVEHCRIQELFADSKFLETGALSALMHALAAAAGAVVSSERKPGAGSHDFDLEGAVICNELLVWIALRNRDRITAIWSPVLSHFKAVLGSAKTVNVLAVERAALGLLRLSSRLMPYKDELLDEFSGAIRLLLSLDPKTADALMDHITHGVMAFVKAVGPVLSPSAWDTVCRLLQASARHPDAAPTGFQTLSLCIGDQANDDASQGSSLLSVSNARVLTSVAESFCNTQAGGELRSCTAVSLISTLALALISWVDIGDVMDPELLPIWADTVASLHRCCLDDRPGVRDEAIVSLQRVLLASEPISPPPQLWVSIWDGALLPLLDSLLGAWTYSTSRRSKEVAFAERSLRLGIGLVAKVFLQFMSTLRQLPDDTFLRIWEDILDRYSAAVQQESELQEAVPETLKNILLVCAQSGALGEEHSDIWKVTWRRCQAICADLTPVMVSCSMAA